MRRGILIILLFTILLTAVAGYALLEEWQWDKTPKLTAEIMSDGGTEEVSCWGNEQGEYYIFLPSYADLSQVRLRTHTFRTVRLDGLTVEDGMSCDNIELDHGYVLEYNRNRCYSLEFVRSANVPTLYIDTTSGSMDYIHETKGNKEAGVMRLYNENGTLSYTGNLESIKGRGNATWNRSKKPYSITLSSQASLLGMEDATRWILLANDYDCTHMRNKLAYDFAQHIGLAFTPECKWTDVYLNGEYAGLYLLSERNEVHPNRVNIPQDNSFLVSIELQSRLEAQNYLFTQTQSTTCFRIHHAGMDVSQIQQLLQSVENAIFAEDGIDPVTGKHWEELIDVDSWARKYLLEEIFANYDAGFVSQYFYYTGDGKLYAGPVWDFDNTLACAEWQNSSPQALLAGREYFLDTTTSHWLGNLFTKERFCQELRTLYREEVRPLLEEWKTANWDVYTQKISQASIANALRCYSKDPISEVERLRTFFDARLAFLDSLWIDGDSYCKVYLTNSVSAWSCFAVRPGEVLTHLPATEYSFMGPCLGWIHTFTGEPFDVTQPVYQDQVIQLRWE